MIKTLQRKFITTAMIAISILILVLLGAINVIYYWTSDRQADRLLNMLSENEGMPSPEMNPPGRGKPGFLNQPIDEDTAMSARYFLVRLNLEGEIKDTDISRIASVTEDEAKEYALEASKSSGEEGKTGQFRYKKTVSRDGRGSTILFLDISSQTQSILFVLMISIVIGVLGWGCMLLLVIVLSKKAILPIAKNMEKQKQFVTDAGHEIKTPLAIILANTDAMELHNGENKWSHNIREQTVRLSGLMQNLLSLAKMDEDGVKLPASDITVSSLVEEILYSFKEPAGQKGAAVEAIIQPDIIIHANKENIVRLITILLDNAVKYINDGGTIRITLDKHEKSVFLRVENTCDSLPEGEPEKLFDRFYRGDSARTQKSGGYGIGLSVARSIVEAEKGSISAAYKDRNTIIFTVKL